MQIVICASIDFTPEIKKVADRLIKKGHQVDIPFSSQQIIEGKLSLEEFLAEKNKKGDNKFRESALRKIKHDVIKRYYNKIKKADAILVLNFKKKQIKNYIGGNTFLEIGFAHVLDKPIYLYNPIPDLSYTDEIKSMQPVVIDGDLGKIEGSN
jgi:nucleoside 2-deoxyribosyltransferase